MNLLAKIQLPTLAGAADVIAYLRPNNTSVTGRDVSATA
jgi:hypothetical protein